jgi:hypothetical protein
MSVSSKELKMKNTLKRMMIDATWQDMNGNQHKLYTVRSNGQRGFMVVNRLRNIVVLERFDTREEARDYLRNTEE